MHHLNSFLFSLFRLGPTFGSFEEFGGVSSCLYGILISVTTLALGLRPKQGGCKVAGQEGNLGVTSHVPGSAKNVRA